MLDNTEGDEFIMQCQYQDDTQPGPSTSDEPQPGPSTSHVYRDNEDTTNRKHLICYNNFHIIKTRSNISSIKIIFDNVYILINDPARNDRKLVPSENG